MERLQPRVQEIRAKARVPTLSTVVDETDEAGRPQEDQPQFIEEKQENQVTVIEESETWDSSDKHEVSETRLLSVEPEESGMKSHELPIKAQKLEVGPAMERDIGKSFMERRFTQEKEKLEKGLHTQLKSVTEEKENLHQQIWVLSHYHEKVKELTKKLGTSEQQLKNRIEASRILEQDLQTAQNKSTELAATLKILTQENIRSKLQNQADSIKIEKLDKRRREVEYDLKEQPIQLQQQQHFRTQSQIEQQLRAEIEIKSQKTKELTIKMERQEKDVREVQQLAISMKRKLQPTVLADGEIREELEDEVASMKKWATKWAVSELTCSRIEYESNALQKELKKVILIGTPPKQSTKDLLKKVKPRIAVHALLAQFFAERIFLQGFLTLDEAAKTSPVAPFSASMTRLLELLLRKDPAEAHAWRAHTLQLLAAASPSTGATDEALASEFLAGPSKLLLQQIQTMTEKQELIAMITSARALSSNMWKRRAALEIRGLDYYQRQPYRGDSEEMEAHRVHRLEEGGREADGRGVRMVVQPGFFARGNEDGEGYGQAKVWGKAVVLLQ